MSKSEFILEFEKPIRGLEAKIESLHESSSASQIDVQDEIETMRAKLQATRKEIYSSLSPWQRIQIARHPRRPTTFDYIQHIFSEFQELHGDRTFKDDHALIGGIAILDAQPVMLIGHQKGRNTKENLKRNFGCPNPEGYRKALRLMKQAEKFDLPIITLVDTPGAYPGIGAEERHVAEAIAVNIREMSIIRVPIITVIIGEGGSGGALGIAVANKVSIMENSYYSVISPEGCAAILWKDRAAAPEAAEALKLGAKELKSMDIVDHIIHEPLGGAHHDYKKATMAVKGQILNDLKEIQNLDADARIKQRYERFRKLGSFIEVSLKE